MSKTDKTLLIVVNVDWFFISHRLCIAKQAIKEGWRVVVATKDTGKSDEIKKDGIEFINLSLSRASKNPISELKLIGELFKIYKTVKPSIVHHVTLKPVIYGSIIARFTKINALVNAISGLGYNFTNNRTGYTQLLIQLFLKWSFNNKKTTAIFQNNDDYQELLKMNIINNSAKVYFIKGSGVDLAKFKPDLVFNEKSFHNKVCILFPSRFNWDKGVSELKEASEILKESYLGDIVFLLCGRLDDDSKNSVPLQYINNWQQEGYVEWLGEVEEMVVMYQKCDIVVHPSYREGMPKSLLEACASGKPIVTTNAIGCKECVDEGLNGYKVPIKSAQLLADALEKLINAPEDRKRMGIYSRQKAEREFDQQEVVKKHMEIYNELL
jgi:glycosyltransferase involved in cell wall biosynthesis